MVIAPRGEGSSITHVRNKTLEMTDEYTKKGTKPFGGMEYDYMMWIDSDNVFEPEDFFKLLHVNHDIVTGLVPTDATGRGACGMVNGFNPTKYVKIPAIPQDRETLIDIEFCGFAFLLIKRGVFEAMEYPWFGLKHYEVGDKIVCPAEDFEWCIRAGELGYKLYAHPQVRIGHEKLIILNA